MSFKTLKIHFETLFFIKVKQEVHQVMASQSNHVTIGLLCQAKINGLYTTIYRGIISYTKAVMFSWHAFVSLFAK